jgi:RND superfamily putative drug exporter
MFEALARLANRHAKRTLILALVVFAAAGVFGAGVADKLDPYGAEDPDTESVQADERLEAAGYRETDVVVLLEDTDPRSPAGSERIDEVTSTIADDPAVAKVSGYANTRSPAFVSKSGDATYLAVALKPTDDKEIQDAGERIHAALEDEPDVLVGGSAVAQQQTNEQVEEDLRTAELYAFPILFLLSLLFFRSLVAAALPLLIGGLAIVGTFLMLSVYSEMTSVSIFALNLVTGLGLGLAIDYSLFVVSRYREELAKNGPGFEAIRRTMATSGRTVLFSSLTVAGAAASLLVFPQRFLYSMGLGGATVALIAAAIALIVLPAVLVLLGPRVNAGAPAFLRRRAEREARATEAGFWYRLSRVVMRFPGRIAALAAGFLIALGIPFLSLETTSVDAQTLPESATARQVDSVLRAEFPPYRDTPITVAVDGRAPAASIARDASELPGAADVAPLQELDGGLFAVQVYSSNAPLSDESQELVRGVRALDSGSQVTGFTAGYIDLQESLLDHLPIVLAIMFAVTFVVLFLMTGSVVLPIKQVLMNFLGLSATLGILVLIFQDGRFEELLGYTSPGGLESTNMLFLFAVVFGLSTDYGVFLLSRIKEARDSGFDNSEAVAVGLERTGRVVTAAAVLFAVAIGAFVTSKMIFIQELGLGTAIAVLLDATIIRALLVPSLMELLGRWNWWAPRPLRRLHDRFGLSEA